MTYLVKYFEADIEKGLKAEVEGQYPIKGVLTSYKKADRVNDVLMPGCIQNMEMVEKDGLPMYLQHNNNMIIGKWTKFSNNTRTLKAEGFVMEDTVHGIEAMKYIKHGVLKGISIGFRANYETMEFDPKKGEYKIHEIELMEASLVTTPANLDAQITETAKSLHEAVRKAHNAPAKVLTPFEKFFPNMC